MAAVDLPERVLDIEVPPELIADGPVEIAGRRRDDVRMLVAERSTGRLTHARAADLDRFLWRGDVLVVNTSPTLPAAIPAYDDSLVVHLSTHLGGSRWVVEVRKPCGRGSRPPGARSGWPTRRSAAADRAAAALWRASDPRA